MIPHHQNVTCSPVSGFLIMNLIHYTKSSSARSCQMSWLVRSLEGKTWVTRIGGGSLTSTVTFQGVSLFSLPIPHGKIIVWFLIDRHVFIILVNLYATLLISINEKELIQLLYIYTYLSISIYKKKINYTSCYDWSGVLNYIITSSSHPMTFFIFFSKCEALTPMIFFIF